MPFCANAKCPHRKKTGSSAEFVDGVTLCSDCGSVLVALPPETKTSRNALSPNLKKRLFVTVSLVFVSQLLMFIPPPGINYGALFHSASKPLLKVWELHRFSIVSLGVMPYIAAYMIIEMLSVIVVPLKAWRKQGAEGRKRLLKSARILTILLVLIQGYAIALNFENVVPIGAGIIVSNPGWAFRLPFALSLAAGTFLFLWIADMITAKGLGHGISILLFIEYAPSFIWRLFILLNAFTRFQPFETLVSFLITISLVGFAIYIVVAMEKRHTKIDVHFRDGTETSFSLKMTTAGIIPLMLATTLTGFLLMLASYFNLSSIVRLFSFGTFLYYMCYFVIIIILYFMLTAFFHNPDDIVGYLHNIKASVKVNGKKSACDFIDKKLEFMIIYGAAYLITLAICFSLANRYYSFSFGVAYMIVMIAISLDIIDETRFRKAHNKLSKVAEFHDLTKASLLKELLEKKGIPCVLRGYYHRALLYFFGPYIEVAALVPQHQEAEAFETMDFYDLL